MSHKRTAVVFPVSLTQIFFNDTLPLNVAGEFLSIPIPAAEVICRDFFRARIHSLIDVKSLLWRGTVSAVT